MKQIILYKLELSLLFLRMSNSLKKNLNRTFIMRVSLTITFLTVAFLHVFATTNAQKVSLHRSQASLKYFIEQVSEQTDYRFLYTNDQLSRAKPVNLNLKDVSLIEALQTFFKGQALKFALKDNTIIIQEKNASVSSQDKIRATGVVKIDINGRTEVASGVSIREKGTNRMVVSNAKGDFTIEVNNGATLVFSRLGYSPYEVKVIGTGAINVILQEELQDLNEVVVTGYQSQERRTITGAMAQVKAADFENMPIQSFDQAMQGRMAGVLVQGGSGVPGGPVKIEIRGQGSISAGTQPLYIVDGAEINAEDAADHLTASNPLSFLNPDDIESIEVLKDAAAASIYGAQAANGVVLITTKKGKVGKTNFSANYYKGITEPMPLLEVLNSQQYLNVRMEAVGNLYPEWSKERVRTEVLSQSQLPIMMTDAEIARLPTYDWQSEAFKAGTTDNVQLVVSGGSEKTTFRLSTSFNKTGGNVIGNDFTRGTVYLRLGHEISRKLKLDFSSNLSTVSQNASYRSWGSYAYLSSPQYSSPLMLPFLPIYLEDGSFNAPPERLPGNLPYNAIQVTDVNTQNAKTNNLLGNFGLNYEIIPGLTFQSKFGLNYRIYNTEWYIDPRTQEAYARQGYKSFTVQPSTTFTTSQTFVYDKIIRGGHNFNALLGAEYRSYDRYRVGATAEGFPSYLFRNVSSAATILGASETSTSNERAGFFTQLNYNFMKKYMLSAVLRYDGSSRFGANNRFGFFPAFSAGWDASGESFLKELNWMQQLKFRASYGETGNSAIGDFASRALWNGGGSHAGLPGTIMSQMGNDDLRWERNISTNLGLDFSLFKRKLYGSIDAFHRRSADLLLRTPLPWTSGFSTVYRNVGEVVNKGLEIELKSDLIRTKDFRWNSSFNISFFKNKVTKLYKGITEDDEDGEFGEAPVETEVGFLPDNLSIRLGMPLNVNFRNQYAGVNAATGKPMWWYGEDRLSYSPAGQGSTSYTPYGRGNRNSDYFGGFINSFKYKGLELGVFFQYDMGRELYNSTNTRSYRNGETQTNSIVRAYELRWLEPGQITAFPRSIEGGAEELASSATMSSSRFLEDASYIRLKELSLTYKVPLKFINRYKLSNLEVYAKAVNVLTWTKWTGYDPEFYIDDTNFTTNTGQIPQTRTYTIGFKMGF